MIDNTQDTPGFIHGRRFERVTRVMTWGLVIGLLFGGGWFGWHSWREYQANSAAVSRPAIPALPPVYTQAQARAVLGAFGETKEKHWPDGAWAVWMTSNPGLPDQCLKVAGLGAGDRPAEVEQTDWKRTAGAAVTCPFVRTTIKSNSWLHSEYPGPDPAEYEPINPRAALAYRLQQQYANIAADIPFAITKPDVLAQPLPQRLTGLLPSDWTLQPAADTVVRAFAPAPPVTNWVGWMGKGSVPLGVLVVAPTAEPPTACVLWMPDATTC